MTGEPTGYFCTGSLLTSLPCGKPAARVRATNSLGMSYIAYLCLDHKGQARSAGWIIEAEPRTPNAN
jgi:hypothetical protein